jgi:hypothetical protein
MRTTVRLDDTLFEQAKREAARRHATLTALIEQGLRLVLAQSRSARRSKRVILPDVNVLLYAFRTDSPDHAAY